MDHNQNDHEDMDVQITDIRIKQEIKEEPVEYDNDESGEESSDTVYVNPEITTDINGEIAITNIDVIDKPDFITPEIKQEIAETNDDTIDKPDLIAVKEKQIECDVCHKRFLYRTQLRAHYYIHTGEKRFECDICHKRFTYSSAVKQHRYTHTGEKPYQCKYCEMSFNNATSLKCHTRLHTGITPYQCQICGKKFIDSTGLRHHRKVHEKKTTECPTCHKSFPDSSIESHKLTHVLPIVPEKPDINRPFHCDICDKRFTLLNYLNKHKLIHAGKEPFRARKQITYAQQEMIVEAMEDDLELFARRSNSAQGRKHYRTKWEMLVRMLNRVDGGSQKSTAEWQKAWVTFKGSVKCKANPRAYRARGKGTIPPLTDLEERVLKLLGKDFIRDIPTNSSGSGAVHEDGMSSTSSSSCTQTATTNCSKTAGLGNHETPSGATAEEEKPLEEMDVHAADINKIGAGDVGSPVQSAGVSAAPSAPPSSRSVSPCTTPNSSRSPSPVEGAPPERKNIPTEERRTAVDSLTGLMERQVNALESIAATLASFTPLFQRFASTLKNANKKV